MNNLRSLQSVAKVLTLAYFVSLIFTDLTYAQPLLVSLSSAQYTTYVEASSGFDTNGAAFPPVSRTTFSASPISDEIDLPIIYGFGEGNITHAIANAGLFNVSDQTGWGKASAEAVSQIWFSPLADQTQTLNFQIQAEGSPEYVWTAGQVSLLDLTSDSELWNYSWNAIGGTGPVQIPLGNNNIPWDAGLSTANLLLPTDFLASHQYELTMIVDSNAGDDLEITQIQLTGLQVVPEPSSVLLLALCTGALAFFRWLLNIGHDAEAFPNSIGNLSPT